MKNIILALTILILSISATTTDMRAITNKAFGIKSSLKSVGLMSYSLNVSNILPVESVTDVIKPEVIQQSVADFMGASIYNDPNIQSDKSGAIVNRYTGQIIGYSPISGGVHRGGAWTNAMKWVNTFDPAGMWRR